MATSKQNNIQQSTELAMLATYFSHPQFNEKLKDVSFQNFILAQKDVLLHFLINAHAIYSAQTGKSIELDFSVSTTSSSDLTADSVSVKQSAQQSSVVHSDSGSLSAIPSVVVTEKPVASRDQSQVMSVVKQICSEKTGYPIDFLEDHLDLEADLGIDTIKQMEIVAAVREHYALPKKEGFTLKQVPTLSELSLFVQGQL